MPREQAEKRLELLDRIVSSLRAGARKGERGLTRYEQLEIADYREEQERLYRRLEVGY